MSAPRLFCAGSLRPGDDFPLPDAVAHHAIRVLRMRQGDAVVLFDGSGGEYPARISSIDRQTVLAEVAEALAVERESPLPVTLVQALQSGDKMDVTIQKAVELGVTAIVPVVSRRCVLRLDGERAARRLLHWRQVVIAACEQCGRNRLPAVHEVMTLEQWLAQPAGAATRLFLSPLASSGLVELPQPGSLELLIGPEGGLDDSEAAAARSVGYLPVRLGPRVLRTETAGMAALAAIQALWGDFV